MKTVLIIFVLVAIGVAVAHFQFDVFTPAHVKAYVKYRETVEDETSKATFSEQYWLQARKTTVDVSNVEGNLADLDATEVSYWMPLNAASPTFATIVTQKLYAEMEIQNGEWVVTYEEITDQSISTYEDRKNKGS